MDEWTRASVSRTDEVFCSVIIICSSTSTYSTGTYVITQHMYPTVSYSSPAFLNKTKMITAATYVPFHYSIILIETALEQNQIVFNRNNLEGQLYTFICNRCSRPYDKNYHWNHYHAYYTEVRRSKYAYLRMGIEWKFHPLRVSPSVALFECTQH